MKKILVVMILCGIAFSISAQPVNNTKFQPGQIWADNNGIHINAHGGGILYNNETYYWFGEHKIAGSEGNKAQIGVHCYSSKDLYNWNVAGIDPKISIEEGDEKHWNEIININLRGYYFCIRSSLKMLRKGKGKSIVNISSINYRLGVPGRSIYSITKAGIIGLTTGLARELGKEGMRINSISPGWIFTERQKEKYFNTDDEQKNKKYLDNLFSMQSIKIKIQPEDIANHVLFLLSDVSRATTGHNLIVDGGWLLE